MDREPLDRSGTATVVAVIFGASEFPRSDALAPSPAFESSAKGLAEYLKSEHGFGLAEDQVLYLFNDETSVIDQNDRLIEHLQRHRSASDLIVYYVGHGGFLPDREYFLALRSTRRGSEGVTGLRVRALAHTLDEYFPGKRVFLILDCCFAGEAVAQFQSSGLEEIIKNDTYEVLPSAGTSLLCAASRNEPAISPTGATYTMFSDCLLEVLREGFEDSRRALSLADVGEVVEKLIKRKFGQSAVRPEVHSPHQESGDIARVPLFPNPGYKPPEPKALPSELLDVLRNPLADIRLGAVRSLAGYFESGDEELANLARVALETLANEDDSVSVQRAARDALGVGEGAESEPEKPPPPKAPSPPERPSPPARRPVPERGRAPDAPRRRGSRSLLAAFAAVLVLAVAAGAGWWLTREPPTQVPKDEVAQLLDEADAHLRAGRLTSPEGRNAAASYRAVLGIAPDNGQARKGLERVLARLLERADQAMAGGDLAAAKSALASADEVEPGSARVADARARLEKAVEAASAAKEIGRLLADAEDDMQADRLTGPPGNNAVARYRAVLKRDSGNAEAQDGLRRVVERLVSQAEGALESGDPAKARERLAEAEGVAPGDPSVAKLRARLARAADTAEHSKEIESLLAEAAANIEANQLTTPENDNAVYRFRKVLALDPGNQAARAGLQRVVKKYIELADTAIDDRNPGRAGLLLDRADDLAPGDADLAAARARLEKVQAEVDRLLVAAREAMKQGRDVPGDGPEGQTALDYYRAASKLDGHIRGPKNVLFYLERGYLKRINDALARYDVRAAKSYFEKYREFFPRESSTIKASRLENIPERIRSTAAFAIFPFESLSNCFYSVRGDLIDAVDARIGKHEHAKLAYSYYTDRGAQKIPPTNRLWSSNVARREPIVDAVREAGHKLGVNGVLTAWYKCSHQQYMAAEDYEVDVYLIDVDAERVFHSKRKFIDVDDAVSDVFDAFFASRRSNAG